MADNTHVGVIVTIADSHIAKIDSVITELGKAGLEGVRVLPLGGVVMGKAPQNSVPSLRSISGVAAVEIDGEMWAI